MIKESKLESLNYNDILILPNYSDIPSRDKVNLFVSGKSYMPIFSSPMKNISEPDMIIELSRLGGIGLLHRFFNYNSERYEAIDKVSQSANNYGISISIQDWDNEIKFVEYAVNKKCQFVCIDTASGHMKRTIEAVQRLYTFRKDKKLRFDIISGNVCTQQGCIGLAKAGSDMIRVNIGSGLQCLTSKSIGIGCPTLTAIKDCSRAKDLYPNIKLIADGGIYTPGDGLKALAFGSDYLMVGSLFGRAKEANNKGIIFGMSSYALQERMNKTKKSNEGKITIIPQEEIRPLEEIFSEFTYGLKSGISQLGCDNINDLHDIEIEYIKVR